MHSLGHLPTLCSGKQATVLAPNFTSKKNFLKLLNFFFLTELWRLRKRDDLG